MPVPQGREDARILFVLLYIRPRKTLHALWFLDTLRSIFLNMSLLRYLRVTWYLSRICSASFLMQIIYNSLYQSPLFQYKFDVSHAPLYHAQRDPLGIRLWICFCLLTNEVQKGWKTGAIYLGFSVNWLSVFFLFKPDTAKHRWSWEVGREKADFVTREHENLQSKNGKFQYTKFPSMCWKLVLKAEQFVINRNLI